MEFKFLEVVEVTDKVKDKLPKFLTAEKVYVQNDVWDFHIFLITDLGDEGYLVEMFNLGKVDKTQELIGMDKVVEKIEEGDVEDSEERSSLEEAVSLVTECFNY